MSGGFAAFERALDTFEGVLRIVPPDRWASPSPCEGWIALDVAGHTIGGLRWATGLITGAADLPSPSDVEEEGPRVLAGDEPLAAWAAAREELQAACKPEALLGRVRWPFGEQTVDQGLEWFSLEVLVHSWDLAQAAGVEVRLDLDLVRDHLVRLRPIGDLLRGPGMYGPELEAPQGADDQDQFLAFLGRKVVRP